MRLTGIYNFFDHSGKDINMAWITEHSSVPREHGLLDPSDTDLLKRSVSFIDSPILVGKSDSGFPKMNLIESDTKFIVELGLSGWKKCELDIEVLGDTLIVGGESKNSTPQEGIYLRRELKRSKFSKTIILGKALDRDNIEAIYEDGLLIVTVPKLQKSAAKPTQVSIK